MRHSSLGLLVTTCLIASTATAGIPSPKQEASPGPALGAAPGATMTLPPRADGAVELQSRAEMHVSFVLRDATHAVGQKVGDTTTYTGGLLIGEHEFDVVYRSAFGGMEDFVHLGSKPSREVIAYDVDMTQVAGLRLVAGTLEMLDAKGVPRLRVRAPHVLDAGGVRRAARLEIHGCAYDTSAIAPWGRPVVAPHASTCEVRVRWGGEIGQPISYPAIVDPAWVDGGGMVHPRNAHAAVLLDDGRVLVAGGYLSVNTSTYSPDAEIFDPTTGTWAVTASMNHGRARNAGILLTSGPQAGKALFAAGDDLLVPSAEIYDPATATWTDTAAMTTGRDSPKTTLLADGRVLVAGGCTQYSSTCTSLASSAEIYDPATGTWTATSNSMAQPRAIFTLTALQDGRALAGGGCTVFSASFACFTTTASADLFDPATDSWSAAPAMTGPQQNHVAAVLSTGEVLLAGGTANASIIRKSQIFDPIANSWALAGDLVADHDEATATLLPSGNVLVAGSWGTALSFNDVTATSELFDPATKTWTLTAPMITPHGNHTATLLDDGRALVAGGFAAGANFTLLESGVGEIFDETILSGSGGAGVGGAGGGGAGVGGAGVGGAGVGGAGVGGAGVGGAGVGGAGVGGAGVGAGPSGSVSSTTSAGAGASGGSGPSGAGGAAPSEDQPADDSGCGCRTAGERGGEREGVAALLLMLAALARSRRRIS